VGVWALGAETLALTRKANFLALSTIGRQGQKERQLF
jgi:hypothetical protein